ncbi:unnamed protein product [Ceratitis capitata]|uniref:(Mediterranean fruit fly) hypothetical protein n=1 Tax=Ceratitis capitata TaxID=7213 RepID=A0A811V3E2_CERCA|nr:unnamed protein product [Ceratitis capitata]
MVYLYMLIPLTNSDLYAGGCDDEQQNKLLLHWLRVVHILPFIDASNKFAPLRITPHKNRVRQICDGQQTCWFAVRRMQTLDIKPPQANVIHPRDSRGSRRKEKSSKEKKHSKRRNIAAKENGSPPVNASPREYDPTRPHGRERDMRNDRGGGLRPEDMERGRDHRRGGGGGGGSGGERDEILRYHQRGSGYEREDERRYQSTMNHT